MTNSTKAILALVAAVVIGGFIWGGYSYPTAIQQTVVGSPAGSSFSTSKVAEVTVPVSTSTWYTSYNSDASDRTITGAELFLAGNGAAGTSTVFSITCGTSTNPYNVQGVNIFAISLPAANGASIFGTTTGSGYTYVATSSPGITGTSTDQIPGPVQNQSYNQYARIWKAGTYLNCVNVSTVGGTDNDVLNSANTGYIAFPYRGQ